MQNKIVFQSAAVQTCDLR